MSFKKLSNSHLLLLKTCGGSITIQDPNACKRIEKMTPKCLVLDSSTLKRLSFSVVYSNKISKDINNLLKFAIFKNKNSISKASKVHNLYLIFDSAKNNSTVVKYLQSRDEFVIKINICNVIRISP